MSVRFLNSRVYSLDQIRDFLRNAYSGESFIVDQLLSHELIELETYFKERNIRVVCAKTGYFLMEMDQVFLISIDMDYQFDGSGIFITQRAGRLDDDTVRMQEHLSSEKCLMDSSRKLICRHESDGVFGAVSPSSFSLLGYRPEELVGNHPADFFHPDDLMLLQSVFRTPTDKDLTLDHIQYRLRRKNGTYIWMDTDVHFLRDKQGTVLSIITDSRDITSLKEVEIQLRNSEERFRGIADNIPGVIYLCLNDELFSMLYLNRAVENLTGYNRNDFLTNELNFVDLYHPDDHDCIFKEVHKALKNDQPFHISYQLKHKNGSYIWVDEYGQGIYEGGELKFIEGVLLDTTERKQAEALLQQREANLQAIFESTESMIGLFDQNKHLIEFNKAFSKYAKNIHNIDLYKGMDLIPHLDSNFQVRFTEYQDRVLQGETFSVTLKYPSIRGILYLRTTYNPIFQKGKISGISIFVEDVTVLKQSEKELEHYAKNQESLVAERTKELEEKNKELVRGNDALANTLKDLKATQAMLIHAEKMASLGVLSAGIGHEINNPLNFIKNGCSALMQELEYYPDFDHQLVSPYLKIIDEGVQRASGIVRSLSHFSRQVESMSEPCVIANILDNCLVILNARLKDRITVVKKYGNEQAVVTGNEGKMHQVFLNVLANAEQAIEGEGTIGITVATTAESVSIVIEDDGTGISPEHMSKIGDPFFTTKEAGSGTGLGLFITYSLVKELQGELKIESTLKKGTKVMILFSNP